MDLVKKFCDDDLEYILNEDGETYSVGVREDRRDDIRDINLEKREDIKITKIRDKGFKDCKELSIFQYDVDFISIGKKAFAGCISLRSIIIPEKIEKIDEYTFEGCSSLVSVYILDDNITTIGKGAFADCKSLKGLFLPKSLITIESLAFKNCALKIVKIPRKTKYIADDAFLGCKKLFSISIENGNEFYTSGNYRNAVIEKKTNKLVLSCWATKPRIIESTITKWAYTASEDLSLCFCFIPDFITKIEDYAYSKCRSIIFLIANRGKDLTIGDYVFSESTLCDADISRVVSMGVGTFKNCKYLRQVRLSNSIESIESETFLNCRNLKIIIIPKSINYVTSNAFEGCEDLRYFYDGSEEEFNNSKIRCYLTKKFVYFYSKKKPENTGNYWHYDRYKPVIWDE